MEIIGLIHRQIGRMCASQNLGYIGGGALVHHSQVDTVRHQAARLHVGLEDEHRWYSMFDRDSAIRIRCGVTTGSTEPTLLLDCLAPGFETPRRNHRADFPA